MAISMQVLRSEHVSTLAHVMAIRHLADGVGMLPVEDVISGIDEVEVFLSEGFVPQAIAEEHVLYPEIERVVGDGGSTRMMRRDHMEIARLTTGLSVLRARVVRGMLTDASKQALRRILYGLDAIISLHVAKEEEVYLPVLEEHLSASEQAALVRRMKRTTAMQRHPSMASQRVAKRMATSR